MDRRAAAVDAAVARLRVPFRTFDVVRKREDNFSTVDFRFKILRLVADNASGKSSYAKNLSAKPLIPTMQEVQHLDPRCFQVDGHKGLVMDNVNSSGQSSKWRAALQGRNAKSVCGQCDER